MAHVQTSALSRWIAVYLAAGFLLLCAVVIPAIWALVGRLGGGTQVGDIATGVCFVLPFGLLIAYGSANLPDHPHGPWERARPWVQAGLYAFLFFCVELYLWDSLAFLQQDCEVARIIFTRKFCLPPSGDMDTLIFALTVGGFITFGPEVVTITYNITHMGGDITLTSAERRLNSLGQDLDPGAPFQ